MELLDSLNTASFLVTQPAAAAAAAAAAEEEEEEEEEEDRHRKSAQRVKVRHYLITQPDSNDPSRPPSIRTIPPAVPRSLPL